MSAARRGRALLAAGALAAVLLGAAARAEARMVDLRLGLRAGGLIGNGTGGGGQPDFFDRTRGPGAGFDLGLRLLIFDVSANFTQLWSGDGRAGTLTQFLFGLAFDIPIGRENVPDSHHKRSIVRPGAGVGIGLGTPRPVSAPLDNAQVSDKGIVSYGQLAWEYFLSAYIGVGAQGLVGYHYFLWGAINSDQKSSGWQLAGFATMTFHLGY